uniref:B box-type domain-containing protein n=1 Tax=Daucus carota subsp. sativus TaxID=79200 RepID=A0A166EFD0_DAUCS
MIILQDLSVKVPAWVEVMCTELFFNPCESHEDFRKNKEDGFCIDCHQSFCCNCLPAHAHHRHLKIRRYVYCEVINRQDLCKFFDCSGIQVFSMSRDEQAEEANQHSIDEKEEDLCNCGGDVIETLSSPKRQKLRKGVALRAPMF